MKLSLADVASFVSLGYKDAGKGEYTHCLWVRKQQVVSGFTVHCLSEDSLEAFLFVDGSGSAIMVIRGTESELSDVLTDVRVWPVRNPKGPGYLHRGVCIALSSVWESLTDFILDSGATSVRFAGHSLGGMLSTVAACWFSCDRPEVPVSGLVTFGSPCAVSASFCSWADSLLIGDVLHVANGDDAVFYAGLPWFLGFRRFGRVHITSGLGTCYSKISMLSYVSRMAVAKCHLYKGVSDHRMSSYLLSTKQGLDCGCFS